MSYTKQYSIYRYIFFAVIGFYVSSVSADGAQDYDALVTQIGAQLTIITTVAQAAHFETTGDRQRVLEGLTNAETNVQLLRTMATDDAQAAWFLQKVATVIGTLGVHLQQGDNMEPLLVPIFLEGGVDATTYSIRGEGTIVTSALFPLIISRQIFYDIALAVSRIAKVMPSLPSAMIQQVSPSASTHKKKLSAGAIAGITIGTLVVIAGIGTLMWLGSGRCRGNKGAVAMQNVSPNTMIAADQNDSLLVLTGDNHASTCEVITGHGEDNHSSARETGLDGHIDTIEVAHQSSSFVSQVGEGEFVSSGSAVGASLLQASPIEHVRSDVSTMNGLALVIGVVNEDFKASGDGLLSATHLSVSTQGEKHLEQTQIEAPETDGLSIVAVHPDENEVQQHSSCDTVDPLSSNPIVNNEGNDKTSVELGGADNNTETHREKSLNDSSALEGSSHQKGPSSLQGEASSNSKRRNRYAVYGIGGMAAMAAALLKRA